MTSALKSVEQFLDILNITLTTAGNVHSGLLSSKLARSLLSELGDQIRSPTAVLSNALSEMKSDEGFRLQSEEYHLNQIRDALAPFESIRVPRDKINQINNTQSRDIIAQIDHFMWLAYRETLHDLEVNSNEPSSDTAIDTGNNPANAGEIAVSGDVCFTDLEQ